MANPDHVKLLRQGREAILAWRVREPFAQLDASGATLTNLDLRGADLSVAALEACDLRGSKLEHAELFGANLSRANLSHADLQKANLHHVILSAATCQETDFRWAMILNAHLDGTDFRKSDFRAAHLRQSDVARAQFAYARFGSTAFSDLALREAEGLDSAVHDAPSFCDSSTLFGHGHAPPSAFLQGCGVPDAVITMLPSIIGSMEPIQFYSCFISHSSKDEGFARRLHGRMEQEKLRVWFAPEDMKGGRKMYDQIDEAIRVHDKLLLVLSEASMASEWVKTEIRRARAREVKEHRQVLFPIRLVGMDRVKAWSEMDADIGKDMAVEIRELHIPDFSNWKDHDLFEAGFARLLRDLKKSAEPSGAGSSK